MGCIMQHANDENQRQKLYGLATLPLKICRSTTTMTHTDPLFLMVPTFRSYVLPSQLSGIQFEMCSTHPLWVGCPLTKGKGKGKEYVKY